MRSIFEYWRCRAKRATFQCNHVSETNIYLKGYCLRMAKESGLDALKKLPADRRIEELKKLIEKETQELAKAKKVLSASEREIQDSIQQQRSSREEERSISSLVREEAAAPLEETVAQQSISDQAIAEERRLLDKDYVHGMRTERLYAAASHLQEHVSQKGYISEDERREAYTLNKEFEERREAMAQGTYATGENISELLNIGESIAKSLYRSTDRATGTGYTRHG